MKSKYELALKFFTESKNEEQLNLSYKEIEGFLGNYYNFKFFIEINKIIIDPKVLARLDDEQK